MPDRLHIPDKLGDRYRQTLIAAMLEAGMDRKSANKISEAIAWGRNRDLLPKWEELENWSQRNVGNSAGYGFDAIIDPDLPIDDPTTMRFTTVRAALVAVKAQQGGT